MTNDLAFWMLDFDAEMHCSWLKKDEVLEYELNRVPHGYVIQVAEYQFWLKGLKKFFEDKADVKWS